MYPLDGRNGNLVWDPVVQKSLLPRNLSLTIRTQDKQLKERKNMNSVSTKRSDISSFQLDVNSLAATSEMEMFAHVAGVAVLTIAPKIIKRKIGLAINMTARNLRNVIGCIEDPSVHRTN
jgi:hypothetical protein